MIRRARADKHVMTTPPTPDEEDSGATATPEAYIEVTTADIRTAKRAWLTAQCGGAPEARIACLQRDYEHLLQAQVQQIVEELRASDQ